VSPPAAVAVPMHIPLFTPNGLYWYSTTWLFGHVAPRFLLVRCSSR